MLHRWPNMRAYMGWQWRALFDYLDTIKINIAGSIEEASLMENIQTRLNQDLGSGQTLTINLPGQRR